MRIDQGPPAPDSLTSRLSVFHRAYRGLLLALLAIGAAMAAMTFAGSPGMMLVRKKTMTSRISNVTNDRPTRRRM